MFQRALICTDFEDRLYRLVNFVPSLAAGGLRSITFLHTVPVQDDREIPRLDSEEVERSRDRLSKALENVPEGIDVQVDVQSGRPSDRIVNAIKQHNPEVVILGTPRRTLLDEQLFGSTTQALCKQIKTPVLILRPQLVSAYTNEELDLRCRHLFRYLLIPYDGSSSSSYLIERVKLFVQKRPPNSLEKCFLCWVIDTVGRRGLQDILEYQVQEAEAKIASAANSLKAADHVSTEYVVLRGNAMTEVLNTAVERDISAIAISSESMGKLLEWSVPSFARELMRQSWHPVLYFPPERG